MKRKYRIVEINHSVDFRTYKYSSYKSPVYRVDRKWHLLWFIPVWWDTIIKYECTGSPETGSCEWVENLFESMDEALKFINKEKSLSKKIKPKYKVIFNS